MSTRTSCRACGSTDLVTILDFGVTPLADVLLTEEQLGEVDREYPLRLVFCPESALVQITEDVPPEILYGGDYPYYTSVNPGLVQHFTRGAREMMRRKPLTADSLVIEAASNDGYQLAVFREAGARVLGIDPASGPARVANEAGIETLVRFFDAQVAEELFAEGRQADLLTGNNVLNLIQDLDDFMRAVDLLLKDDGMLVLEVPYLVDTIDMAAFDNVFHQNTTYWTATSLDRMLRRWGLFLNDVEHVDTFGGSLRVYCSREEAPTEACTTLLARERERGVHTRAFYAAFASRVEGIRTELLRMLGDLRAEGKRVVAYGAGGGMATSLLAYLGLDGETLEYAVDINPHKHGRYTAGSRLLVRPAETLLEDRPDVALLLAWNFEPAVLSAQAEYRERGGRFLVPIPEPRLV